MIPRGAGSGNTLTARADVVETLGSEIFAYLTCGAHSIVAPDGGAGRPASRRTDPGGGFEDGQDPRLRQETSRTIIGREPYGHSREGGGVATGVNSDPWGAVDDFSHFMEDYEKDTEGYAGCSGFTLFAANVDGAGSGKGDSRAARQPSLRRSPQDRHSRVRAGHRDQGQRREPPGEPAHDEADDRVRHRTRPRSTSS